MAKQPYSIKADPALLAQLRAKAHDDRTSVTALFEQGAAELLAREQRTIGAVVAMRCEPSDPAEPAKTPRSAEKRPARMPQARRSGGGSTRSMGADRRTTDVGATCRRCVHEVRKHTPACYVAGCACRRAS